MKKNFIKKLIIYLIIIGLQSEQICFAVSMDYDNFSDQNLAPIVQVNAEFFRDYFKNDLSLEKIGSLTKNSFVALTDKIKEDKALFDLYNKLNKLGPLDEKETILSLLVMTNGQKAPIIRLFGCTANAFRWKIEKYKIKDDIFNKVNTRDIYIKTGLAKLRQDDVLYLKMDDLTYGFSGELAKALGPKLLVKHKLYDGGQLGRFKGESYRFIKRPNEEVEVTVEYGFKTKIKFLSDNTYGDGIARIYDTKGRLIGSTRKFGLKIKDLIDNTVVLELNKTGGISIAEATGARLNWGKNYTHFDGRKFDLEGKQVRLTINHGIVIKAVLIKQNVALPVNIVFESETQVPVHSFVSKITKERMAELDDHYVMSRLSKDGTLEAGGTTWCRFTDCPNFRIKYFINKGWVRDIEVYDNSGNFKRQKIINLVYDKQDKIVDFLRKITLESISKLDDHTIDCTLYRDALFIANEKNEAITGSKGLINLGRILPEDTRYPINGRLIIKNGIIISFECERAKTDDFNYVVDLNSGRVLFYFNGMVKDVFAQLDNVAIIKKVTKATDSGALKCGGGSVYIKFPQWLVGSWVMFEVKKGKKIKQVKILNSKDYSNPLKDPKGKPIIYRKKTIKGRWQFSCSGEKLKEGIKLHEKARQGEKAKFLRKYVSRKDKQAAYSIIQKREIVFMQSIASMFNDKSVRESISLLHEKALKKGFLLNDQPTLINLIRLLHFGPRYSFIKDIELLNIKNELLPKISFSDKAKLILNQKENEIFIQMFGQIQKIYLEYKRGNCNRAEALLASDAAFKVWRKQFAVANNGTMEEKVFISFLAKRLMRIFFQGLKATFDQVQDELAGYGFTLLDLNDRKFQNSAKNLLQVKELSEKLLAMGWEIRFMKSSQVSTKIGKRVIRKYVDYISIDKLIDIQDFFQENDLDFLEVRKGLVKTIPAKVSKNFEKKFGFKINGLVYQQIIANIRMIEQSEQKVSANIFDIWFSNRRGVNAQLVSKKEEVLKNLNLIFDKGFQEDQEIAIKDLGKEFEASLKANQYMAQAI